MKMLSTFLQICDTITCFLGLLAAEKEDHDIFDAFLKDIKAVCE